MKKLAISLLTAAMLLGLCVESAAETADFSRDTIYCTQHRYYFDKEINGETAEAEEWEFSFEIFDDATFTVNTVGQADLLLGANCDYDEEVGKQFPEATLLFFNGNGDYFRHYGTLFIPAKEGSYIYANVNRRLYENGAVYDSAAGGFSLRTKHLGGLVISDRKLDALPAEQDSAILLADLSD